MTDIHFLESLQKKDPARRHKFVVEIKEDIYPEVKSKLEEKATSSFAHVTKIEHLFHEEKSLFMGMAYTYQVTEKKDFILSHHYKLPEFQAEIILEKMSKTSITSYAIKIQIPGDVDQRPCDVVSEVNGLLKIISEILGCKPSYTGDIDCNEYQEEIKGERVSETKEDPAPTTPDQLP